MKILALLKGFKGKMDKDSIGTPVYYFCQLFIYNSIISTQIWESKTNF